MLFSYLETYPSTPKAVHGFPYVALHRAYLGYLSSTCLCRITFSFKNFTKMVHSGLFQLFFIFDTLVFPTTLFSLNFSLAD